MPDHTKEIRPKTRTGIELLVAAAKLLDSDVYTPQAEALEREIAEYLDVAAPGWRTR
jgi:hypothetical protein